MKKDLGCVRSKEDWDLSRVWGCLVLRKARGPPRNQVPISRKAGSPHSSSCFHSNGSDPPLAIFPMLFWSSLAALSTIHLHHLLVDLPTLSPLLTAHHKSDLRYFLYKISVGPNAFTELLNSFAVCVCDSPREGLGFHFICSLRGRMPLNSLFA